MVRALLLFLLLINASAAQAQGLLELLFGNRRPPPTRPFWMDGPRRQPAVAYLPPATIPQGQRNPYTDGYGPGAEPPSKPEKVEPPPVGKGPLGPFLYDTTLRNGDVVVTTQGLYVFRGGGGALEHRVGDFIPLALAAVKSQQLVAIDRATRRGKPPTR
jgi:hypothetical protein